MSVDDRIDELCLVDWPEEEGPPSLPTLRPPDLHPRAVLLIRSLSVVGAPRRVGVAVEAEVASAFTGAARPHWGRLPLEADAVVFADETEARAAFLVALVLGTASRQWWWRHLEAAAVPEPVPALLAAPHPLAVVAHLVRWRFLAATLDAVPPWELAPLVRAVAGRHGLSVRTEDPPPAPSGTVGSRSTDGETTARRPVPVVPTASSRLVVTRHGREIAAGPSDHDGALVVLEALVVAVLGRVVPATGQRAAEPGPHGTATPALAPTSTSPTSASPTSASPTSASPCATHPGGGPPVPGRADHPPAAPPRPGGAPGCSTTSGSDDDRAAATPPPRGGEATAPAAAGIRVVPAASGDEGAAWPAPPPRELVHTEVAGALFLVNPLGAWSRESAASPEAGLTWDLLELVGRSLLGRDDDPLWATLTALAGRDEDEPPPHGTGSAAGRITARLTRDLRLDRVGLAELLAVPGIVVHDLTHVDVELPMHRVNLATRRRGLDVDPGWVPGLARVVSFHYRDDLP